MAASLKKYTAAEDKEILQLKNLTPGALAQAYKDIGEKLGRSPDGIYQRFVKLTGQRVGNSTNAKNKVQSADKTKKYKKEEIKKIKAIKDMPGEVMLNIKLVAAELKRDWQAVRSKYYSLQKSTPRKKNAPPVIATPIKPARKQISAEIPEPKTVVDSFGNADIVFDTSKWNWVVTNNMIRLYKK